MADEAEEQLAKLLKAMVRAQRRGRQVQFDALSVAYGRLKARQMEDAEREHRDRARARRAAETARQTEGRRPWRLPFTRSPGAVERDRMPRPPAAPQLPSRGHLSPWRRGGSPASERIWNPGP